ncbi:hypothetical protein JOC55_005969 [Paenibacillus sacheonensis]|nr:hypothetical protein [Paenibacillus sacheonensis]
MELQLSGLRAAGGCRVSEPLAGARHKLII